MNLPPNYQAHISAFFDAIRPVENAYQHPVFNFVAILHEDKYAIAQAALLLDIAPQKQKPALFNSLNVRGGSYSLAELNLDPKGLLEALYAGVVKTPDGDVHYLKPNNHDYPSPFYVPFHDYGIENRVRLNILRISSRSPLENISSLELDWQLKGEPTPYESLQELAFTYRLGQLRRDQANVEIVGYNVAAVDLSSKIEGTKAWPTMHVAPALDPSKVRLGYRIQEKSGITKRGSIAGGSLNWEEKDGLRHATAEIDLPTAAILHCIASYDGITQQFGLLLDPKTVQNPRRAVLDGIDTGFPILNEIILNPNGKHDSTDLEAAVSWILWMLGFSPAHFGDTKGMKEGVDIVAVSPAGNMALVECTVSQLKSDKVSQLHDRAESARQALIASGNPHLRVLPVIVTSKPKKELASVDIEKAERLGILVYSREDLLAALDRTRFVENAEELFSEAEGAAASALTSHNPVNFDQGPGEPHF